MLTEVIDMTVTYFVRGAVLQGLFEQRFGWDQLVQATRAPGLIPPRFLCLFLDTLRGRTQPMTRVTPPLQSRLSQY